MVILLCSLALLISQCNAQLLLNQEVCEVAKYFIENRRMEFRCDFEIHNLGKESVRIDKEDFELPCTCTNIDLINGLIVPGSSISFSIVYALDPINTDTYEDHLKEFYEEDGRHQEIPLRISETKQEFTLMLNYFLKGLE